MKKILLLFVLFLGFSFGAYASNEIESLNIEERYDFVLTVDLGDIGSTIIYRFQDGSHVTIDDGTFCTDYWSETSGGGSEFNGTICNN